MVCVRGVHGVHGERDMQRERARGSQNEVNTIQQERARVRE